MSSLFWLVSLIKSSHRIQHVHTTKTWSAPWAEVPKKSQSHHHDTAKRASVSNEPKDEVKWLQKGQTNREPIQTTTAKMDELPSDAIGSILTFAVEKCPNKLGARMCSFALVSKRWKAIVRGEYSGDAWELVRRQEFPGSMIRSHAEYMFLYQPNVQSAARVIQRALCRLSYIKSMGDYGVAWEQTALEVIPCCVCGVRWTGAGNSCELPSCPFIPQSVRNRGYPDRFFQVQSRFFVCRSCGFRFPELAMGSFYCRHERESFLACFKCAGECDGSLHHYWHVWRWS